MDEKQLLQAIGKMMDEKLVGFATKQDIKGLVTKEDIKGFVTKEDLQSLREEMSGQIKGLNSRIDSLQEEMTSHNRETRIIIENGYKRIENLLHEDYGRVEKNAAKGAALVECHEELKSTVADHNRALIDHKERIEKLEEAI